MKSSEQHSVESHRQILKSSAIVGASSLALLLLGAIRSKMTAVYLGSYGVGLMGTFVTITSLVATVTGLGLNGSGVRQIAKAAGGRDETTIAVVALVLKRLSWIVGAAGAGLLYTTASWISVVTFGSDSESGSLRMLSLVVLLSSIAAGQGALLQGLRRLGDRARANIAGAAISTVCTIPLMLIYQINSIVPILVLSALSPVWCSWYFCSKVKLPRISLDARQTWAHALPLLKLGVTFMASAAMTAIVTYCSRVVIVGRLGLEAAGIYGAAWQISGVYAGFILQAMGADFYPRLTAISEDEARVNKLVNEQTETSLLIGLPGLLGTLTFAPWAVEALYSAEFLPAAGILRWQVLGLLLRLISWPMGFIILAKGRSRLFFWIEVFAGALQLSLLWAFVQIWGLQGAGIAFVTSYIGLTLVLIFVSAKLTGFKWDIQNKKLLALGSTMSIVTLALSRVLPTEQTILVGATITLALAVHSAQRLNALLGGGMWRKLCALKRNFFKYK